MERLTRLDKEKDRYVSTGIAGKTDEQAYFGEAVERLATFENIYQDLLARQISLPLELERLRSEGKSKSYQFKEIFAQKLVNETMLSILRGYGLK